MVVGEFVEIGNLTTRRLSELIVEVTANPNYRDKARWLAMAARTVIGSAA